jgi:gamma-glutamyltranspeptidase / glutathione hydrolase
MGSTWLRRIGRMVLVLALVPPTGLHAQGATGSDAPAHRPAVPGTQALVTGGHPLASMAGARILLQGGNAFDATVAVLATLNAVKPAQSGAGGNGFFTVYHRESGAVRSLNATGAAPMGFRADQATAQTLQEGILAGIVPGLFGGWIELLESYGTLSLKEVLEPAIQYARYGHPIDPVVARGIASRADYFRQWPTSARAFLPGGRVPEGGERFALPDLANTFQKVVDAEQEALARGADRSAALRAARDRFYTGDIAREIVDFIQEHGGVMAMEDLAAYRPIWADPVRTTYRGHDVYTSPSTSRGGYEVVMGLSLVEPFRLRDVGHNSARALHLTAEAIKVSKADIYHYVADPAFTRIPEGMTSRSYADQRRALIDPENARPFPAPGRPLATEESSQQVSVPDPSRPLLPEETMDGSTDSFSVVDRWGNVVAATPTHGSGFGTGVVLGNTGLTLNNGLRIGSTSPYPDQVNYPRAGQIPILNNSPILVFRDGRFVLSLGTPGGETIGQAQFQVLLNVLEYGMGIQEAIEAPRMSLAADPNFYRTGAEITIRMEGRVDPTVVEDLRRRGHRVDVGGGWGGGNMQGILVDLERGTMTAGADPRNLGYAVGW